jgi:hypothetical protein
MLSIPARAAFAVRAISAGSEWFKFIPAKTPTRGPAGVAEPPGARVPAGAEGGVPPGPPGPPGPSGGRCGAGAFRWRADQGTARRGGAPVLIAAVLGTLFKIHGVFLNASGSPVKRNAARDYGCRKLSVYLCKKEGCAFGVRTFGVRNLYPAVEGVAANLQPLFFSTPNARNKIP